MQTVGTTTDFHDLQPTPDGNYLLLSYRLRSGVDTSAYNGDADATVYDGVVQKVTPDGQLVWEWSTAGPHRPGRDGPLVGRPSTSPTTSSTSTRSSYCLTATC